MNEGKKKYPQVEITYGSPFGIHPKIVDSLYDRVVEQENLSKRFSRLLVGRGSSDQAVKQDLNEIASLLGEKYFFDK